MRQRNMRELGRVDSYQFHALSCCTCPPATTASHTFTSRKRKDVVDAGIVDADYAGPLSRNDGEFQALAL